MNSSVVNSVVLFADRRLLSNNKGADNRLFPVEYCRSRNLAATLVRVKENELRSFSLDQDGSLVTALIHATVQYLSKSGDVLVAA